MTKYFEFTAAAAALFLTAGAAGAASISVTTFSPADYRAQTDGFTVKASENFEGFAEGNAPDPFATAVGTFTPGGGTGTGGTIRTGEFDNDGSLLAIRDGNVFGRSSTTASLTGDAGDDMFLDSNDTHGINWNVDLGGASFNRILLTMTDSTDQGARMQIDAGGATETFAGLGNANQRIVLVEFGRMVDGAAVSFTNFRGGNRATNDGFSLDDIAVGAVPLPAAAWLMLGGLGALVAARRRPA